MIQGFVLILKRLAEDSNSGKVTHKEIKAYSRCMLKVIPELSISSCLKAEIEVLMTALCASGIPHYDRSFLAAKIVELLESEISKSKHSDSKDLEVIF